MVRRIETAGWALVGAVLIVLAVPWFLWGDGRVAAGLPLWLWWHIGWMGLTSVVFYAFTRRAWGVGIEMPARAGSGTGTTAGPGTETEPGVEPRADAGGER